ncbi:hypothetical protein RFI_02411 [Reticulomyxa filosa]|uniref:Uncharacterized protein n=1 Tax=Reticulomyxa filosa TaxID=46433 RepID=X6P820_RETFI|nr:hypothetical protein RFI_02411 [Reticulomyxa filosa]|eukprot:ETO34680.1 hypothetical protein RFI_02411 [Reticulomyxa filosa]
MQATKKYKHKQTHMKKNIIETIEIKAISSFWWIAIIDSFQHLHVLLVGCYWPQMHLEIRCLQLYLKLNRTDCPSFQSIVDAIEQYFSSKPVDSNVLATNNTTIIIMTMYIGAFEWNCLDIPDYLFSLSLFSNSYGQWTCNPPDVFASTSTSQSSSLKQEDPELDAWTKIKTKACYRGCEEDDQVGGAVLQQVRLVLVVYFDRLDGLNMNEETQDLIEIVKIWVHKFTQIGNKVIQSLALVHYSPVVCSSSASGGDVVRGRKRSVGMSQTLDDVSIQLFRVILTAIC